MTAGVSNPSSSGGALRALGAIGVTAAGTSTITPPVGTRFIRMDLRGGGGSGGGQSGNCYGGGGGEGGHVRLFLPCGGAAFTLIVGAGARNFGANVTTNYSDGINGGDTSALGFVAAGGSGGKFAYTPAGSYGADGAGGVGVNGVEPMAGFGTFNGASGSGGRGGGMYATNDPGIAATMGSGGGGAGYGGGTRRDASPGGNGGDGWARIEFFG